ncbi:HK97 family phage prohead protease [Nocardioides terrigena]|uniref:HK97 family phage prohead protease n=1 Tax=Nocardioides terrigena TaxID=424797 RepID=UPI000D301879|nr:HK97 family phage prohead protease [Nocardioides terrigena]
MLLKDMPVRVKAGPDDGLGEGQFSAYASVFGNVDSYGDVVTPGAFADDLKAWEDSGNPIPLLFGHNMSDPDYNIGHVMSAVEDDKGLLVTAQLDLENPKAMQTYRMLKGRRVNQMSFAYDVLEGGDAQREKSDGAKESYYELRKLKLYEVSVVTIGANQETEVLAVKSAADALLSGTKAGRAISAKNEGELRKAHEAIGNVLAAIGQDDDQEKASGTTEAKSDAIDEEPIEAKSTVSDEEPKSGPSVNTWATHLSLLALDNE